jgi:hypothetical protein
VFGLMEENLDSVKATQSELRARTNEHEYETFQVIAAGLTADEIAARLVDVMNERNQIFDDFVGGENEAVAAINEQLDRQELISQALNEPTDLGGAPDLEDTIARLDSRLDWIDTGLERFEQVQRALESGAGTLGAEALADLGDHAKEEAKIIAGLVDDAQRAMTTSSKMRRCRRRGSS